ncbi:MAG: 50S ribosomal protein L9 [Bradymonadaceae bacterium]
MEVILTDDVPKLGHMGEIVEVADGYGRNYLIPEGLAELATPGKKAQIEHRLEEIERQREKEREEAREILDEIDGTSISIPERVAESDRLYGSVSARDIADVLDQEGIEADHKDVQLEQPIRELGIYKVPVKLASGIYADVKVWVVAM